MTECLVEGSWADVHSSSATSTAVGEPAPEASTQAVLVGAADGGLLSLQHCTGRWFASHSNRVGQVSLAAAMGGRVHAQWCELQAVGRPGEETQDTVLGLSAGAQGAVVASRSHLVGCGVIAEARSSLIASHMHLQAEQHASRAVASHSSEQGAISCSAGGLFISQAGIHVRNGATGELRSCSVSGFAVSFMVSADSLARNRHLSCRRICDLHEGGFNESWQITSYSPSGLG